MATLVNTLLTNIKYIYIVLCCSSFKLKAIKICQFTLEIKKSCRCHKFLAEYIQFRMQDIAANLAVDSIYVEIYDLAARLGVTMLNAAL